MRIFAIAVAAFVVSGPAVAQSWEEFNYPEYAFSVVFPTNPKVETIPYEVADGRMAPARVYSARQDKAEFKMTIADLANTGLDEKAVIDHAVKRLSKTGTVRVNVPAGYAHWVSPDACYNRVGYYEVPNARVVYRQNGQLHSFGIASMISWRGVWYVVHLGAVLRPAAEGIVDDPSSGAGVSAPSSTC